MSLSVTHKNDLLYIDIITKMLQQPSYRTSKLKTEDYRLVYSALPLMYITVMTWPTLWKEAEGDLSCR